MFKLITVLGNVVDKTGKEVVVKYSAHVGAGPLPLLSFYYRSMADTIDNGHAWTNIEIHDKCKAVYVEIDDKIVGACVVDWDPSNLSLFVVLTAIDKDYRGRGLYKIIFDFLEQKAKELGAVEIISLVSLSNTTSLEARKSVGMMPVAYKMRKPLNY
jgi:GNAT superfamily N-acetyltransferase